MSIDLANIQLGVKFGVIQRMAREEKRDCSIKNNNNILMMKFN